MKDLSSLAKIYISLITAGGILVAVRSFGAWEWDNPARCIAYWVLAVLGSGMKVSLPGITGTMSVNYVFILLGILQLSLGETLVLALGATLTQSLWKAGSRPKPIQLIFNVASMAISVAATNWVYSTTGESGLLTNDVTRLALASCVYFLVNTLSIAGVIALTENNRITEIWRKCYFWSFPYYLVGASIAGGMSYLESLIGWEATLVVLPVIYIIYRSYRLYLRQLEEEKKHAQEMADLHLRTIEALALAIEAKDHTTSEHLKRVQVYAGEIGKELGLDGNALMALQAASILHDIGKLAVPDYIISKPGRLTPEEFEKMKIHPVVGAEILARVDFPYAVVPVVRCHHERWDGTGYPDGLIGEAIPIGARILSAVDCLDALATDRQYRRALPLDQAMEVVISESGKSFDPTIVGILKRRYLELEEKAAAVPVTPGNKLSKGLKVERGEAPGAGFEKAGKDGAAEGRGDFLSYIAAARQEVQSLYEFTQDLGNSLSPHETLSLVAARVKTLVPYDAIAVYIRENDCLKPKYVNGENFKLFSSLEIPVGQGLSGWVAQNKKPIMNGNPSVEPGYLNDPTKFSTLRSALAVPLEGIGGVIGVLSLYCVEKDAFSRDHLRVLLAVNYKVSLAIENALTFQQAQIQAARDSLTGLPNASSLFVHLDTEISRCQSSGKQLTVLVCDLDGFKQVNDRWGHLEGNRALQSVAQALSGSCGEFGYVARMGGDEFVLVLPGSGSERAERQIRDMAESVRRAGREVCGVEILDVSVGVATYPDDGLDAETILAEADRRMYKVKYSRAAGKRSDTAGQLLALQESLTPVEEMPIEDRLPAREDMH
ncbi:MAG: HD domain-containing phosphohydrolase [Bryobacteraceae bacterium]